MKKKKVSFNIDEDVLGDIQEFCSGRDMKLSDYFRVASQEKFNRDKNSVTIYLPIDGTVKKMTVDRHRYIISLKDASADMKENVGAVQEGTIRKSLGVTLDYDIFDKYYVNPFAELDKLLEMPPDEEDSVVLGFYTKEKYPEK